MLIHHDIVLFSIIINTLSVNLLYYKNIKLIFHLCASRMLNVENGDIRTIFMKAFEVMMVKTASQIVTTWAPTYYSTL